MPKAKLWSAWERNIYGEASLSLPCPSSSMMRVSSWRICVSNMMLSPRQWCINMSITNRYTTLSINWRTKIWKWRIAKQWQRWNYNETRWWHHSLTIRFSLEICHYEKDLEHESPYPGQPFMEPQIFDKQILISGWNHKYLNLSRRTCKELEY